MDDASLKLTPKSNPKPTVDYRYYAKLRMAMKKKIHWPKHCWDGNKLRKMTFRDYLVFIKILITEGAYGIQHPKYNRK